MWKEEFDNKFIRVFQLKNGSAFEAWDTFHPQDVKDFISQEIIEKLIADTPDHIGNSDKGYLINTKSLKQQLKDKWL